MSSIQVIEGVPHIHGVPAQYDDEYAESYVGSIMGDVLTPWRCPHCSAHLSVTGYICLNACHLTAPQLRNFISLTGKIGREREGKGELETSE